MVAILFFGLWIFIALSISIKGSSGSSGGSGYYDVNHNGKMDRDEYIHWSDDDV